MGGRFDRFSEWRLDVDHMSYEQLLELSDRIGYVCTGLKDEEISRCLRKLKFTMLNKKCSICQEEFEEQEELGTLDCGHCFHIHCIKHWLSHQNACPVCKSAPFTRSQLHS